MDLARAEALRTVVDYLRKGDTAGASRLAGLELNDRAKRDRIPHEVAGLYYTVQRIYTTMSGVLTSAVQEGELLLARYCDEPTEPGGAA